MVAGLAALAVPSPALAEREVSLAFAPSGVGDLQKDWPGAVASYRQLENTRYVSAGKPLLWRLPGSNGRFDAAKFDALLPDEAIRLTITLPDNGNVVAVGRRAPPAKLAPRLRIWQGVISVGAGEDRVDAPAVVAWDDATLRVDVDLPGRILRVRSVAPDTFSFYQVDTRGLPPDHAERKTPLRRPGPLAQDGTDESDARPPVKFGAAKPVLESRRLKMSPDGKHVMLHAAFAFTREGAAEVLATTPGPGAPSPAAAQQALVDYAVIQVTKANAALAASRVDVELELVAVTAFALNEPSGNNRLKSMSKLMPASSTHAADLHCWWGQAGKDPARPKEEPGPANLLFLVGSFGGPALVGAAVQGICGMSWKPHGTYTSAADLSHAMDEIDTNTPSSLEDLGTGYYGYAILKNACVDQYSSLLHELGHILGTDHQREAGLSTAVNGGEPLVLNFLPGTKSVGFGSTNASNSRVTVEVVGDDLRAKRSPLFSNPQLAPAGKWGSTTRNSVKLMNVVAPILGQRSPPMCQ